jgi:hypothetical protein
MRMTHDELERTVLDIIKPYASAVELENLIQVMIELESRLGVTFGPASLSYDHFKTVRILVARVADLVKVT